MLKFTTELCRMIYLLQHLFVMEEVCQEEEHWMANELQKGVSIDHSGWSLQL